MYLTRLAHQDTEGDDAAFRELWGELSTLRRFHDGSVCEAVAWTGGKEGLGDRRGVPGMERGESC